MRRAHEGLAARRHGRREDHPETHDEEHGNNAADAQATSDTLAQHQREDDGDHQARDEPCVVSEPVDGIEEPAQRRRAASRIAASVVTTRWMSLSIMPGQIGSEITRAYSAAATG